LLNDIPFVIGDQVEVTGSLYTGRVGKVELTYATMTVYGPYAKVWVRLSERRVETFKPEHLSLLSPTVH
jgi:hypothetical protein